MVEPRVTDRRLVKQGAAVGVDAYGEQGSQCLPLVPPESFGVLRNGDGVEVDDGVYQLGVGLLLVLQAKPLPQGTDIVARWGTPVGCMPEKTTRARGSALLATARCIGGRTAELGMYSRGSTGIAGREACRVNLRAGRHEVSFVRRPGGHYSGFGGPLA